MTFDQFQRYKTVQLIIEKLKIYLGKKAVSVLEIGGNGQCNLEEMIPNEKIQYSSLKLPPGRIGDKRFIALDGTAMSQVDTDEYDVVIALDVFEHVPINKRDSFLKETYRVAKYITILCFPFSNGKNEEAEKRVNNYYKAIYGKEHIWLKEHIENGLPDIKIIEDILCREKILYKMFEHGDVNMWEDWMKALFSTYDIPGVAPYLESLEENYANRIYKNDVGKYNYRTFLILSKDSGIINSIGNTIFATFSEDIGQDKERLVKSLDDLKRLCNRKPCKKIKSNLYLDYGNGYNEMQKQICETVVESGHVAKIVCKFESLQDVKKLRFDPIEGSACIISDISVNSNMGELELCPIDGWKYGNNYVFLGNDPQLELDICEKDIRWVEIEAILYIYSEAKYGILVKVVEELLIRNERIVLEKIKEVQNMAANAIVKVEDAEKEKNMALDMAADVLKQFEDINAEKRNVSERLKETHEKMNVLENEKADLMLKWQQEKEKVELCEKAYSQITQSKSWRITAPFRAFDARIQAKRRLN